MLITRNMFSAPFKQSQFSLMCCLDNFILGMFRNIPKVGVIIVFLCLLLTNIYQRKSIVNNCDWIMVIIFCLPTTVSIDAVWISELTTQKSYRLALGMIWVVSVAIISGLI